MVKRMSDLMLEVEQYINDLEEEVYALQEEIRRLSIESLEEEQEHEICEAWLEDKVAQLTTDNAFLEAENAKLRKRIEQINNMFYKINREV